MRRTCGMPPNIRIVCPGFAALADPHGVISHRSGVLERTGLVRADWQHTTQRLADTEARIVAVLDELRLAELATSIAGLRGRRRDHTRRGR
jgi:transposase